ncbi:transferase [Lentzea sp. NBRC 105346]|uniref:class I SAM-dependent methyltransferase n=1 Tax=Lentzea sp. NBRC 105346 TaxID=3032205 RepID=UPI0024A35942|nr:class I SAM-dependent methyltransferase [Lentzea sp. NBRC 105346]GLZ29504.1 transferase [Lentzea sp. NBRC 105346]
MIDFEAFYQGAPLLPGIPRDGVPWDIGAPQPVVVALEREGRFTGSVLDAGCGTGDNALFLASKGYRVTAVDIAPSALPSSSAVDFVVADACDLPYVSAFDSVLASALFHTVSPADRGALAASLYRAAKPGALLSLTCLDVPAPPFAVTEDELRGRLTEAGWTIGEIRRDTVSVAGQDFTLPIWVVLGCKDGPS